MAIFKKQYAKKIGIDNLDEFFEECGIKSENNKERISNLIFSKKGNLATKMLRTSYIIFGDSYNLDNYKMLTYLLDDFELDEIISNLSYGNDKRLEFICKHFGFYYSPEVHPSLSNKFVLQLFHNGYTSFNDFFDSYGKVIFESICSNPLYQEKDIDYGKIKHAGFNDFKYRYYSSKSDEEYAGIINSFDSIMLKLFELYSKEELQNNPEKINKRISSGYLHEQLVGNRLCYPGGAFDKYADLILEHFDDETLPLLMRSNIEDRHGQTRVDFPISWYLNNFNTLLESNVDLDEYYKEVLRKNQRFFQKILDCLRENNYEKLYILISSQDGYSSHSSTNHPTFKEQLKDAIFSYQKMARDGLIQNTPQFEMWHPKETTFTATFNGLSTSTTVNAIVIDSYKDIKGTLFRKVNFDDFNVPDPSKGSQFFIDALEYIGSNYIITKPAHTEEEYGSLFYKIAQMIFDTDESHFETNLQDLHSLLTEEEFTGFLKFYAERSTSRNSVVEPLYYDNFSSTTKNLINEITSEFTKPLVTRCSCDEPYSNEIHNKLKDLLYEPRTVKEQYIPVDYVNTPTSGEYEKLLPDNYTLAFALDRRRMITPYTYIINSDPCSDLETSVSTPKELKAMHEKKRKKDTYITKRGFDTYCDQIYVRCNCVNNNALVLFHSGFIDGNMLNVIAKSSKIAKGLGIPLVLVNNDNVKKDIDYQRQQLRAKQIEEEKKNGTEQVQKPKSKSMLHNQVLSDINKYSKIQQSQ